MKTFYLLIISILPIFSLGQTSSVSTTLVSAQNPPAGARKMVTPNKVFSQKTDQVLELRDIHVSQGHTVAVFQDESATQYFFQVLDHPLQHTQSLSKKTNLPKFEVKLGADQNSMLHLNYGQDQALEEVYFWDGSGWHWVEELSSQDIASQKNPAVFSWSSSSKPRKLPPFSVVPAAPIHNFCSTGAPIYLYSYWSGGCLMDVYGCPNTQDEVMSIACCDPGTPGQGGPDCPGNLK